MLDLLISGGLPTTVPTPADTTKVVSFFEKLSSASNMSLQQLLEQMVSGIIHISIKILIALVIFWVGKWLMKKIRKFVSGILIRRNVELSLRTFLLSLINISLMLILLVIVIGILGVNTSSFVALFASAGIAVGMALSGTLQNFAGGVMVLLFKPYKVGDYIEAQGQSGTVKEIQIFNTILNTPDNKTIIVPNGGLSTGIINNYSKEGKRRVDWTFGIGYGDDYDKAKEVLSRMLDEDTRVLKYPAYFIALHSLLFPDARLCMESALYAYGYIREKPYGWHLAVDKNTSKSRFKMDYPKVIPYYTEPEALELGSTTIEQNGLTFQIYDKERMICDCLKYEAKLDRAIFREAIQSYIRDNDKDISMLMEYARARKVTGKVQSLIGVWL